MEEWKTIPKFQTYSISDQGRVRNDNTDRILTLRRNPHGVVHVGLMKGPKQWKRSVPLLVANAFVSKDHLRSDFTVPIHLNGDQSDNRASNLMWRPPWFAQKYARQFDNPRARKKRIIELKTGDIYSSAWEAALIFGLLERELISAIERRTFVWPTYQVFKFIAE